MSLRATLSQTAGPYLHIGFDWLTTDRIAPAGTAGIVIEGRILDGDARPVADAVVEIWQADARGRYAHPEDRRDAPPEQGFRGFGRIATDADGCFRFTTVKPGPVPGPGVMQAPHLLVSIFARGLLKHLTTRMYFPDEAAANAADPILALVPPDRRPTLVARPGGDGRLRWPVVLQGDGETVFFDL